MCGKREAARRWHFKDLTPRAVSVKAAHTWRWRQQGLGCAALPSGRSWLCLQLPQIAIIEAEVSRQPALKEEP